MAYKLVNGRPNINTIPPSVYDDVISSAIIKVDQLILDVAEINSIIDGTIVQTDQLILDVAEINSVIDGTIITPFDFNPIESICYISENNLYAKHLSATRVFSPIFTKDGVTTWSFKLSNFVTYIILGGIGDLYSVINLTDPSHIGDIMDFTPSGFTLRYTLSIPALNIASDTIKIIATNLKYDIYYSRSGADYVLLTTIIKSDYPDATGLNTNSRMGIVFTVADSESLPLITDINFGESNKISQINELANKLTKQQHSVYNVLGDSITAYLNYQLKVQNSLNISQVNSYGVGGSCITAVDDADGFSMCIRYASMADNADLITVFGGTNDYGTSMPFGAFGDAVKTTFYGAVNTLIVGLLAKYAKGKIVFITPIQRDFLGGGGQMAGILENTVGKTLKNYVDVIIEMCNFYAIPVIDLFRLSGICIRNIDTYTDDRLHPNELGHQRIADIITNSLKNQ